MHFTANDGDHDEGNANYFANNVVKTSAHYFLDDDSVTQSVPDDYMAYSVGGAKYRDCAQTGGSTFTLIAVRQAGTDVWGRTSAGYWLPLKYKGIKRAK